MVADAANAGAGFNNPLVDLNDIASVNVNLVSSTAIDETEYTNVAAVNITNGVAGTTLTVNNATLSTVYGATVAGRNYIETVSYAGTTGSADVAALSVANTGNSTTDTIFNVATGNTIEAVTLATSGTNYVTVNGGTAAAKLTVTGNGTNEITIAAGGLASTNAIDLSATTGTNVLDIGTLISSAETVTGGSGDDTLVAVLGTTGQHLPTVSGVENLEISFTAAGTINGSKITGATSLDVSGSTAASTFSNLSADVAALSTIVTNGANAVTFGYASKSAAVVDYNVGGTAAVANNGTTFSNVADLTINAAGKSTSNLGALAAGTAATSLTLTTAAAANDLTVGAITAANLVDASVLATAGDVSASAAAAVTATSLESVNISATGGADVSLFASGVTAHAALVSSFNTLSVVAGDDSTITVGAINAGNGADAANVTAYDVTLGAHAAADTSAIGNLTAYTVGDINVTVGAASAASTLSLNTIAATEVGNITVAVGTNETVSLTNDDNNADGITVGNITATGAGGFTYTLNSTTGDATVGVVDASGLTGVATINLSGAINGTTLTGGSKGDALGGTAGDDIIQGNAGADSLTGNGGSDVFNYTAWSQTGITAAAADTITDFATANDLIDVTTAAGTAANYAEASGAHVLTFAGAKAAAEALLDGTVKYVMIYDATVAAEGILFYGDAAGVATNAIQLSGVNTAGEFDFSNII